MNCEAFFAAVRHAPFAGGLSRGQVDGINTILDEWNKRGLSDLRWLAYMLATTFHETARTMQPIREYGRGRGMRYGMTYYGRGFVQLTWEDNYRKASAVVGVDLVARPDRALEPPIAATILFDGMIKGWFTGHKLADYLSPALSDYVGARRIINGTDRAVAIAGYAVSFERALRAASPTAGAASPTGLPPVISPALSPLASSLPRAAESDLRAVGPPDDPGPQPTSSEPAASGGFFAALLGLLTALFTKGRSHGAS